MKKGGIYILSLATCERLMGIHEDLLFYVRNVLEGVNIPWGGCQ